MIKKIFLSLIFFIFSIYVHNPERLVQKTIQAKNASHRKVIQYDFQHYEGERQMALYRVEFNFKNNRGKFCWVHTPATTIPSEVIDALLDGKKWNTLISDLDTYKPVCFNFKLYEPDGWFFSPKVKYDDYEHKIFFTGTLNKKQMKGRLFLFFKSLEYRNIRLNDDFTVDVKGVLFQN